MSFVTCGKHTVSARHAAANSTGNPGKTCGCMRQRELRHLMTLLGLMLHLALLTSLLLFEEGFDEHARHQLQHPHGNQDEECNKVHLEE